MATIADLLSHHHSACDEAFAQAETSVEQADWPLAGGAFQRFVTLIEQHFSAEETVLFPAFEQATGMAGGPTSVMRMEHEQMRGLFADMRAAVSDQRGDDFLGDAQTLLILMQQHNMKEENILYPMCDQVLAAQSALMDSLQNALQIS